MNEQMMKERIQQALNVKMSGVRTSLAERSRLYENAIGGTKVKRKMTVGLVFAIVLVLMTAAAVAAILLTHQEIVEQVAVPLAVDNDGELGVKQNYSAEELAELVRNLNENGITLEENNAIMQALKTGKGFYEEEAIMEICRQAFGRHYSTWTLEEQDWFSRMMVDIGFYESYESCLPGEENLTYEQAEAYAFSGLKKKYGEKVEPEDRINYYLERSFHPESEEEGEATWYFTLVPMNMEHGRYEIVFRDREPETSMWIREEIRDWSKPYKAEELVQAFESIYGWNRGNWEQTVWQKLHEMMQDAKIDLYAESRREYKGYQMTEYPEPEKNEITRADAIRIAREAMKEKQVAMESAVLTEFEGKRVWLAAWITGSEEDEVLDKIAECYVVTVDSRTGNVESVRTQTADDDLSMAYVPEAAYLKAGEGLVPRSERIKQAIDTVAKAYPGLDLLNEDEYETDLYLEEYDIRLNFHSKNIRHGNVKALVSRDGRIKEMTADEEKLNGDNLFDRYRLVYGYFGKWDQKIWVQLVKDMEPLEPETPEGKLLKTSRYPEEDTVRINHTEAMKLAIKASGKRTAEINTCVLISANPHPVWKLRVISYGDDDWVDQVIELDAETGEVLAKEVYKTDYTPDYVLFSLEKNRRAMELKELGPVEIARREVAYAFGDMSADYPEPEFDDPEQYEIRVDGLKVRFVGLPEDSYTTSYEVELDENGYVLRCESLEPESSWPTPRPDGRPWFWERDIEDETFWDRLGKAMDERGVLVDNYDRTEEKWIQTYGDWDSWPEDCYIIDYFFYNGAEESFLNDKYPVFSSEDKTPKEGIIQKGREALYEICEKSWADNQNFVGRLWNNVINPDTGEGYGKQVWIFALEDRTTGDISGQEIWLDEDGNVLRTVIEEKNLKK